MGKCDFVREIECVVYDSKNDDVMKRCDGNVVYARSEYDKCVGYVCVINIWKTDARGEHGWRMGLGEENGECADGGTNR